MKAVLLPEFGHPVELAEVPDPEPPPGGAVVRVTAAGVCHSDLHLRGGEVPMIPEFPRVFGHEVTGVEELGAAATGVSVGEPVALYGS